MAKRIGKSESITRRIIGDKFEKGIEPNWIVMYDLGNGHVIILKNKSIILNDKITLKLIGKTTAKALIKKAIKNKCLSSIQHSN